MTDRQWGPDETEPVARPETTPSDPWPESQYPTVVVATSRSRRFPGWLALVATLTAALAVASFVLVLVWPPGSDRDPPAAGVGQFGPREQVAQVIFGEACAAGQRGCDDPVAAAFTQVVEDRVYVGWQRVDDLALAALDLATGGQLWQGRVTGAADQHWAGLLAGPGVLVALGRPAESSDSAESEADPRLAPLPMVVLSAADGRRRWERTVHAQDEIWLGTDMLVLADRARGVLRGLRLDNGQQRWAVAFPGGPGTEAAVAPVLTAAHVAAPSGPYGRAPVGPYQRLVLVGADHSARLIDVDTGVEAYASNVARPEDLLLAYDDRLFVAGGNTGYRVDERDLTYLAGQPRSVYVTPEPRRQPTALALCGAELLCLLDRDESEWEDPQVRAIDVGADPGPDPQRWVRDAPYAEWLLPVGDLLMVDGWEAPLAGYDTAGELVLEQPAGAAVRLSVDRLLLFTTDLGDWTQDLGVAGLAVGGDRTELGQLSEVFGAGCSWSDAYLACPDPTAATIWRL